MTKRCGKKWPANLCAPGSLHQCTRPPMHPGKCACKCGTWHRPDLTTGKEHVSE